MASIQLATLWLNDLADLSDNVNFPLMAAVTDTPAIGAATVSAANDNSTTSGQVPIRLYAGGNLRAISQPGAQRVLAPTLYACTPLQEAWFYAHQGLTLLVRDDRGRRFYAQYFTYQSAPHQFDGNTDITLSLTELTGSDAVLISEPPGEGPGIAALEIDTISLPNGQLTVEYAQYLVASGGVGPYEWIATVPPGLTLAPATGLISGIPEDEGIDSFNVEVSDSSSPAPQSQSAILSITVGAAPTTLEITTASLPTAHETYELDDLLIASGGTPGYHWTLESGALPAGVSLAADGVLAGTPTVSGTFDFTVMVTDSGSPDPQTASASLSLVVDAELPALEVSTSALTEAVAGVAYTAPLAAVGGQGPYTWGATGLPAALSVDGSDIVGTPTAAGTSSVVLTVTDSLSSTASATISLITNSASTAALLGYFVSGQVPATEVSTAATLGVPLTAITQYGDNSSPYSYTVPSGLGGRRLVLALGPISTEPAGCSPSPATQLAQDLVEAGYSNAIIRLMWEMNGDWFDWGIDGGALGWDAATYVSTWQAIYDAFMAVDGAEFVFAWNMNGSDTVPTAAYPGDGYVGAVGADQYNYTGAYEGGVNAALAFAAEHSKPFFIGEWGCETGGDQTGDDPVYVNWMANVIKTSTPPCLFQIYFGRPPLTNYPNAEIAYKDQFATGSG